MKKEFYPVISLFFILIFQLSLFGQPFSVLKDIKPGSNGSTYFNFTNINGILYFRPDDGIHGDELWKTNGTEAGTTLVKDINPGIAGSELHEFTNVNGLLYFRADDGIHGTELWKSDGTTAGTTLVKDINAGFNSSISSSLHNINGVLYFQANDGINGTELWKSDGTGVGTNLVKDIYPGVIPSGFDAGIPYSGNPHSFTMVNGFVYFSASGGINTHEVWKTDGTPAGTRMIKDIYSGLTGYSLNNFINLNGVLFFTVFGGAAGNELWKSDGTTGGTVLVKTLSGGNFSNHSTIRNEALYFLEEDGLWKSDGTGAGTVLVKDRGDAFPYSPELLTAVNGLLYFTGYDATHGWELWKSDGTAIGTVLVKDIHSGISNSDINAFAKAGNKLMFSANDGVHGNEIWISDGTAAGTKLLQDIEPGSGSALPSQFFELKGTIVEMNGKIFTGAVTSAFGNEVWTANMPADIGLPLEFLEFKGSIVNNDGLLQWKTNNETNTVAFIIERSTDGRNYQPVGSVAAANSAGVHHYNFTDPNITSLETAIIYYRLKETDIDGKYTYSRIVGLAIEKTKGFIVLYPNPVTNEMYLSINIPQKEELQWQLIDNNGRIIRKGVYDISPGRTAVTEDISQVSPGVYFMQINGQALQQVIKLIKRQ